jgi:hypothetical protein
MRFGRSDQSGYIATVCSRQIAQQPERRRRLDVAWNTKRLLRSVDFAELGAVQPVI